jgi:predicted O-methyltransferase YrrM
VTTKARLRRIVGGLRKDPAGGPTPQAFAPGAFYSPVVDTSVVLAEPDVRRIWRAAAEDPPGLDVRAEAQLALLAELRAHPLPASSGPAPRYDPANDQFPPQDAALLYAMVRHLRPQRMVEVGCGWSTTVAAQAIQDAGLGTHLTCIDPYPRSWLAEMPAIADLRQERVELTPLHVFTALGPNDILFIDSSHVVKTGSDVVHELLEVVPRLADGVVVHVHDVFIPEDYPKGWVAAGFGWNEQYLVQAFLVGNARAEVLAMNRWLALRHPDAVRDAFGPVGLDGSSVWFRTRASGGGRGDD